MGLQSEKNVNSVGNNGYQNGADAGMRLDAGRDGRIFDKLRAIGTVERDSY